MRPVYLHEAAMAMSYDEEVKTVIDHYTMNCDEHNWHLFMFYALRKNASISTSTHGHGAASTGPPQPPPPEQLTAEAVWQKVVSQLQAPPSLVLSFSASASSESSANLPNDVEPMRAVLQRHLPSGCDTVVLGAVADSVQTVSGNDGTCECQSDHALMMLAGLSRDETVLCPFHFHSAELMDNDPLNRFRDSTLDEVLDWKFIILFSSSFCSSIADSLARIFQEKYPDVTIVGAACHSAFVSLPIDRSKVALQSLSMLPTESLLHLGRPFGCLDESGNLTDDQLAHVISDWAKTQKYVTIGIGDDPERRGGICGVAIAGKVPIQSIVSSGVESLTSLKQGGDGTPLSETSLFVDESDIYHEGDEGYRYIFGDDDDEAPPYHVIQSIVDRADGSVIDIQDYFERFGVPWFFGFRRPGIDDGFVLETPHHWPDVFGGTFVVVNESAFDRSATLVGMNFDFFKLSPASCLQDLEHCLKKLKETVDDEVLGGILLTSSLRGREPGLGMVIDEDTRRLATTFPHLPFLGVYGTSTLGSLVLAGQHSVFQKEKVRHQPFAAIVAVFTRPSYQGRTMASARYLVDDSMENINALLRSKLAQKEASL